MSNYPYAVRPRKKNPKGLMMQIACAQPSPKYSVYHRKVIFDTVKEKFFDSGINGFVNTASKKKIHPAII